MTATFTDTHIGPELDLRRPVLAGVTALVLLVVILGGWAATATIGGAVVASGQIAATGFAKEVQHPDGGTVASIEVANGDRVAAGDVVLTLDPTLTALELDIARTRLAGALALQARLLAEQAGSREMDRTLPELPGSVRIDAPVLEAEMAAQSAILAARAGVLDGGRAQLGETLARLDEQRVGVEAQIAALSEQIGLIDAEIGTQQDLVGQGLARQSTMSALLRERAELDGRRAALQSRVAELATQRRDATLATEQAERGHLEQVTTDLRETRGQIEEFVLQIVTGQGQLDRMVVRAPVDGMVHELQPTTIGGVVAPGETLLQIVPETTGGEFEVRVDPASIDEVHVGQETEIILAAFDRNSLAPLRGVVSTVSATAITEPGSRTSFYRVVLTIPPEELARTEGLPLVAGMPVEAYLATGERTVLSYLFGPVITHLRHAMRD